MKKIFEVDVKDAPELPAYHREHGERKLRPVKVEWVIKKITSTRRENFGELVDIVGIIITFVDGTCQNLGAHWAPNGNLRILSGTNVPKIQGENGLVPVLEFGETKKFIAGLTAANSKHLGEWLKLVPEANQTKPKSLSKLLG